MDFSEKLLKMAKELLGGLLGFALVVTSISGVAFLRWAFSPAEQEKTEQIKAEAAKEEYDRGYEQGVKDQMERDFETFTLSGRSVRDIINKINVFYGMTPVEAFRTVDEYEFDSTHGGITWEEYQTAIRVCINTAGMMDDE